MAKRKAKPKLEEQVTPNLIPMVDIMFLLLLFLMLGADMAGRVFEAVILPKADYAKDETKETAKLPKELDFAKGIVNVFHYHEHDDEEKYGVCDIHRAGREAYSKGEPINTYVCRQKAHWLIKVNKEEKLAMWNTQDLSPEPELFKKFMETLRGMAHEFPNLVHTDAEGGCPACKFMRDKGEIAKHAPRKTERDVQIRADANAPYRFIQEVMMYLGEAGFYRVDYGASLKKKEGE